MTNDIYKRGEQRIWRLQVRHNQLISRKKGRGGVVTDYLVDAYEL
jgi:hypothetical protein